MVVVKCGKSEVIDHMVPSGDCIIHGTARRCGVCVLRNARTAAIYYDANGIQFLFLFSSFNWLRPEIQTHSSYEYVVIVRFSMWNCSLARGTRTS